MTQRSLEEEAFFAYQEPPGQREAASFVTLLRFIACPWQDWLSGAGTNAMKTDNNMFAPTACPQAE